jgi:hypothetical protein
VQTYEQLRAHPPDFVVTSKLSESLPCMKIPQSDKPIATADLRPATPDSGPAVIFKPAFTTDMTATFYNPDQAPDPREWLALDEHERIRLAKNYHASARIKVPDAKAHALFHAIVENQIAEGFGPTCRTVDRLQKEGLTRHDAIHAVGSVIAEFTFEAMHGTSQPSVGDAQRDLNARIEALSAGSLRRNR